MPGGIGKASLPMNSPRRFVIRGRLYGRCAGCASAIDEPIRLIHEYLDPRGGQSDVDRARLDLAAWHGLVHEERGTIDMKPGNSAEVPKLGRAERRLVPSDCRGSVRDNQHHRNERPVAFASHQSNPSDTLSLAQHSPHDGPSSRGTRLWAVRPLSPVRSAATLWLVSAAPWTELRPPPPGRGPPRIGQAFRAVLRRGRRPAPGRRLSDPTGSQAGRSRLRRLAHRGSG